MKILSAQRGLLLLCALLASSAGAATPLTPGRTVRGQLAYQGVTGAITGATLEFGFSARPGQRVAITVRGPDLRGDSSRLKTEIWTTPGKDFVSAEDELLPNQDGLRVRTRLTAGGEYLFRVECRCEGPVEVTLEELSTQAPRVQQLRPGQLVRGTLLDGAALSDEPPVGHLYELWRFQGTEGQEVQLTLDSLAQEDHLELKRPGGYPVRLTLQKPEPPPPPPPAPEPTPAPGGEAASPFTAGAPPPKKEEPKEEEEEDGLRIYRAVLPASGEYTVEVHLVEPGFYTLVLGESELPYVPGEATQLISGEPLSGTLPGAADQPVIANDVYLFPGRTRQPVTLTYRTSGATPYLVLARIEVETRRVISRSTTRTLVMVAADHDMKKKSEARIDTVLPADADYVLFAFAERSRGVKDARYNLELKLQMPPTRSAPQARPTAGVSEETPAPAAAPDFQPFTYFDGLFGFGLGNLANNFAFGFDLEFAPGVQVLPFVGLELVASGGMALSNSQGYGLGLVGPGLRLGDPEALHVRLTGGLAWGVGFNGGWGMGPGGRLDLAPFGRGMALYLEAQTHPLFSAFLVGVSFNPGEL